MKKTCSRCYRLMHGDDARICKKCYYMKGHGSLGIMIGLVTLAAMCIVAVMVNNLVP